MPREIVLIGGGLDQSGRQGREAGSGDHFHIFGQIGGQQEGIGPGFNGSSNIRLHAN